MKRVIKIALDEDTAEFLEMCRDDATPKAVNAFINSLLRQERYRQGYPSSSVVDISSQPSRRGAIEDIMLWRSGLLPMQRKPKQT